MFLRFNLFTFLWAGVIFLLILMPGQQMPETGDLFSFDKLAHLGVFCILCFLMVIGLAKQYTFPVLKRNPARYSLIISSAYASLLELSQSIIPERYTNFYDLAFNLAGVFIGYVLFLLIYKFSFV
ncbi:MAG: VanZ family protein [Cyclobacteriaceae bacterium]|nr:VanZ family protein [Cyclobacteriaceae bacterium]MCK5280686.1 VanZ family protein [Cyclobacteriaceae bacterium]